MAVFQSVVLPPKSVWVCWAENPQYWKVSPIQNSRFSQKAELLEVCWLQIQGTFDTGILDKDATYSLLYFFKHNDRSSGLENGAEVSLSQKDGKTICKRQVHLKPGSSDFIKQDGEEWLAIEAGTFQPSGITREISFNLLDGSSNWKSGLVFAGVEIRVVST